MVTILVIDDDANVRRSLEILLKEEGYRPYVAKNGRDGLTCLEEKKPDVILLDICLPQTDGLAILEQILDNHPEVSIIMITGFDDMKNTVTAMQRGAFDYITKPINVDLLRSSISRAVKAQNLSRQLKAIPTVASQGESAPTIIGKSPQIHEIYKCIGSVSANKVTVFIQGESGTGKELIARAIHFNSTNRQQPFVAVNCTALPEGLLESELFGHVKGAFTGAVITKRGKFELAGEGTIFLDEIGDMSPSLQAKLLRVLQEKEFEKVGGEKQIQMRARVIAASHRNLEQLIRQGRFREDLYYRLKIITIVVPPLRERPEDVPVLLEYFLTKLNRQLSKHITKVAPEVLEKLLIYSWPGNVRQLENVLTRALVACKGDVLMAEDVSLPNESPGNADTTSAAASLKDVERQHILKVLTETKWQKNLAAKRLGISKPTLYAKIREYDLKPEA